MNVRCCGALVCWLTLGSVVFAADFWNAKAPEAWSEKEVQRLLSNSPWAVNVDALITDTSLANRVGGLSGGRVGGIGRLGRPGAGGGVGGDGAGNLGGGSFLPSPVRTRLTVRWASALPIRQALARKSSPGAGEAPSTEDAMASSDEAVYRVTVTGVPVGLAVRTASNFVAVTVLQHRRGTVLHPSGVRFAAADELLDIEFTFPRDEPFTVEDREVQFRTEIGEGTIKAAFHVDKMVLKGRLAL